ncbi:MAG: MupA/Atu3671 family FMN-dependent luciferase-like monooxygenase [Bacteroidota bacterium]
MKSNVDKAIAEVFAGTQSNVKASNTRPIEEKLSPRSISFSYLFFSDVRKDISDWEKYCFTRELVEFADASGFEAVYFPERHFYEFGSIYANNGIMAAYFAPLTQHVRLRTAAITSTLHHPVEIVENWAMIDILSNGRVDLGFGDGWNEADFILSPDTFEHRNSLRKERIPLIQRLWRGESIAFPGPGGKMHDIVVYPRPVQPELNVWYVTLSDQGFQYAGSKGYNVFTMLFGISIEQLKEKIDGYRQAREEANLDPATGKVTLMLHTLVHPDTEWVERMVASPFKDYIRSSLLPQMKAAGKTLSDTEVDKMVDYSYARYFQTGGLFGSLEGCQKQLDKALEAGVNEIAFLQDFGVDYQAVRSSLASLKILVDRNIH